MVSVDSVLGANLCQSQGLKSNEVQKPLRKDVIAIDYINGLSKAGEISKVHLDVSKAVQKIRSSAFKPEVKKHIETESSARIKGSKKWPEIKDINAWMVSAESQKFMAIGGLAQVAEDLPMAFNTKSPNKNDKMSVIQPMYINNKDLKLEKKDGKLSYKGVEVEKVGDIKVDIVDSENRPTVVPVEIYKAHHNNTDYIFMNEPKAFNINPSKDSHPGCSGCYVKNENNFDEVKRFAFMSKAVYNLMKEAKNGNIKDVKAPNVTVLNDWHTGPLAPLMRYQSEIEFSKGKISKDTKDYMDNTATVYIVHNLGYAGKSNNPEVISDSLSILFGKDKDGVMNFAQTTEKMPQDLKNPLFKNDQYCAAMMGLSLADRIIPVSENYGNNEIMSTPELGKGFEPLIKARANTESSVRTLTPITNGYSKSKLVPNEKNLKNDMAFNAKCLTNVKNMESIDISDIKLKPFEDGNLENKLHNKGEILKMFSRIVDREKRIQAKPEEALSAEEKSREKDRRVVIYRAKDVDLNVAPEKLQDTPVFVSAGRLVRQKGYHNVLAPALVEVAKNLPKDSEAPIVIIGGGPYDKAYLNSLKTMKDEIMDVNPDFGKRIAIVEGFVHTNTLANAGDFFIVPSNYEPCGLTQLEAMAKGALPVATSTGGLVNTVQDGVDGFRTKVFYDSDSNERKVLYKSDSVKNEKDMPKYNHQAMAATILEALNVFNNDKEKIAQMKQTAMSRDFSWEVPNGPLEKYRNLFTTGKLNP